MNATDAIALMLRLEGGYVDNPADPGGATKYGITQRALIGVRSRLYGHPLPASVADLTADQATLIYQTVQWHDIAGDYLPAALACVMLNSAVNQGTPTAIELLQTMLGVVVDGIMGPNTVAAVHRWASPYDPAQSIAEEFCAHMAARYARLDTSEDQFELGWYRRLFRVYTLAVSP